MKLLIFGATGPTGRALVQLARQAGHQVAAFVRDPARVPSDWGDVELITGDATDPVQVTAAVAGRDAVLSAIGAPARNRAGVREAATRAQIAALRTHGVKRLVSLSSYGVAETRDRLPWVLRRVIVPFYLAPAFADHEAQEALLAQAADLDWVVARPITLTDADERGAIQAGWTEWPDGARNIPRTDVARWMLARIEGTADLQRRVALC